MRLSSATGGVLFFFVFAATVAAGAYLGASVATAVTMPGLDRVLLENPAQFTDVPAWAARSEAGFTGFGGRPALPGVVFRSGVIEAHEEGTLVVQSPDALTTVFYGEPLRLFQIRPAETPLAVGDSVVVRLIDGEVAGFLRHLVTSVGMPDLADPDEFAVEMYADLSGFPFNWTFDLNFTDGSDGFPAGLYVAGGPSFQDDSELRRLFLVDGPDRVTVVEDRFKTGVESFVFATGQYGDGMLLTLPQALEIVRLTPEGALTTFASLGTGTFGPTVVAFGPDGLLYTTDFTSGTIYRVFPGGEFEAFATIPLVSPDLVNVSGAKALMFAASGRFGGGFLAATFSARFGESEPHGLDAIYAISADGNTVTQLATGLTGIEFLVLGPGGVWGDDVYVAVQGTDFNRDGGIYTLDPDGTLSPFLTGIDATDVIFDTAGVLGGGMFVADIDNPTGAETAVISKIWRITPLP